MHALFVQLAPTVPIALLVGYAFWSFDEGARQAAPEPARASQADLQIFKPFTTAPRPERDPFQIPAPVAEAEDSDSSAHSGPQEPHDPDKPDERAANQPLALSATLVRGERRLALINGHLVAEGEELVLAERERYTVEKIDPRYVKLKQGNKVSLLRYSFTGKYRTETEEEEAIQARSASE